MSATEYRYQLQVVSGEEVPRRRIYLEPGDHRVGASPEAQIHLPIEGVSRQHAILQVLPDGGAVLQDLDSRNGTWIGDRRIARAVLVGGERLTFGSLVAEFVALDPTQAGIAIAPAGGGRSHEVESAPRAAQVGVGSTLGSTLQDRLIRSLSSVAGRMGQETSAERAMRLATEWLETLRLDRVEIGREAALVAALGRERTSPPAVEVTAVSGLSVQLWGPDAAALQPLRPLLEVAAALLDRRPVTSGEQSGVSLPREGANLERDSPDLPGAGSLDPRLLEVCRRAAKVAIGDVPILIRGESGAGKEVVARWIHRRSPRASAPFVALNCAALPRELLAAELFGIEKGVATGVERRRGLLEEASGGTLFLDEIGDMAADLQVKVLRVLESRSLYRVGGRSQIEVDVRFLAATHRDLEAAIESKAFRLDLYHRLASFVVEIPPLRDRRRDIALYATHFLNRELERAGKNSPGMTRAALGALLAHRWPGNVRELENELRTAVLLLEPAEPLDVGHLSATVQQVARRSDGDQSAPSLRLDQALRRAETEAFAIALAAADQDHGEAMAHLGISRATFYRKLKELGLGGKSQD